MAGCVFVFTANWKSTCPNSRWRSRMPCTTFCQTWAWPVSSVIQPIWRSWVRKKASKCQRLVCTFTVLHACLFQTLRSMNFLFIYLFFHLYCKITGAAQGCDWGGWVGDHCSSRHNNRHYSIFLTQDLHRQQAIFLLHIPRIHKLSAVYGQGDWPHQKLAVMTLLLESSTACVCHCVYLGMRKAILKHFSILYIKCLCWSVV